MPTMMGKVLTWGPDLIEPNTFDQANQAASLPFLGGPVALMPDAHVGIGATVGSVIPTVGAVIPAAVGVDIGCGMIAVETGLYASHLPDDLGGLHSKISAAVPAGLGKGHVRASWGVGKAELWYGQNPLPSLADGEIVWKHGDTKKIIEQFGTLGSGNHFLEVCLDERDHVWVVLHSGSRGMGNKLARKHMSKAKKLMKRYYIDLPDPDLAYVVEGTDEFGAYIRDMRWAQEYALANRECMMDAALGCLRLELEKRGILSFAELQRINCHHNFTQREHHYGRNMWVTRKGAIKAAQGDKGVIPGSMGAATYIVSGKGNPASYDSCSHGAGRRLSRTKAKAELDEATLRGSMVGQAWNSEAASRLVDEHPQAYKDVRDVMAAQADLVQIDHVLHSVLNYKGV